METISIWFYPADYTIDKTNDVSEEEIEEALKEHIS